MAAKDVQLIEQPSFVTLDNGIAKLTFQKPDGSLTAISYGGMDNILDLRADEVSRGYWDLNWNAPGGSDQYHLLKATEYSVANSSKDCVELSFKTTWNAASKGGVPLSVDKRFIMRSGVSGFYTYAIYDHSTGAPAFDLAQTRTVFVLQRDKFNFMAITDEKQRVMPLPDDIDRKNPSKCQELIVPESVLLTNPTNPALKGEVDDKYQYSMDNKDGGLHGWISTSPTIGFWVIIPSNEARNGGPTKQNLTCHVGPACLAMFHGTHYIGLDLVSHFSQGEAWRKVFGPIFIYLNTTTSDKSTLWTDAKRQRQAEVSAWPYNFVSSTDFLGPNKRGSASGKLLVQDKYASGSPAKGAYVGLSIAKTAGGWEVESKGYQFWVQTGADGSFTIKNVIPGVYYLHGWVPGFIGDYFNEKPVTISAGAAAQLGSLTFVPPRTGPTVWEIGYPDRTAQGFFVPDANPKYINKLFVNSPEKYRQYGLWDKYTDTHPSTDQVFTIGTSDAQKDWFFAHVDRNSGGKYGPTTWQVKFNLDTVVTGKYKLQISIAAANRLDLKVYMNGTDAAHQVFQILNLGSGNAICRHGIHGQYKLLNADIASSLLVKGANTLYLSQGRGNDPLCGALYDYLRLEAPAS